MTEPFYFQQTLDEMHERGRLEYHVSRMNSEDLPTAIRWCFDNIGDGGHLPNCRDAEVQGVLKWSWAFLFGSFYFDHEDDATAFALRFV